MPVYNKRGILLLPKVIVLNPKDGVKGLLRGVAENAVRFPLQRGKVKELRRGCALFLSGDGNKMCIRDRLQSVQTSQAHNRDCR